MDSENVPAVGMTDAQAEAEARRLIADMCKPVPAVPTAHRDDTPLPAYGPAPPVAQPGRPPMSQRAVDTSTVLLSAGAASLPVGAVAIGILLASGHADPTVIGMICAAPAAVAVPILAVARVLRRAKDVVPDVHHHHYNVPVRQDHTTTHTRGLIARTRNELPR
jgi:hypothetical protein